MNQVYKILTNGILLSGLLFSHPIKVFASQDKMHSEKPAEAKMMMDAKPTPKLPANFLPIGPYQPWRLVRNLQLAQDEIVSGMIGAQRKYRDQLLNASTILLSQPSKIWQNERNLNAIALYVLIGGDIAVGKKAMKESMLDQSKKMPLKAALSFSGRRFREAHNLMTKLDHTKLPASMSAQFALAKSMVTSSTDLDQAAKFLDDARRLAPGTLIEEASLRRSTRIAGEQRKFKRFKFITSTYLFRFHKSQYFGGFLRDFAFGLVRMPKENSAGSAKYMKEFFTKLSKRQKLMIATYVARNATIMGKTEIARWASNLAIEGLKPGSKLHTRMLLYSSASGMVNQEHFKGSIISLAKVDREVLDENDRKLFDAVQIISAQLGKKLENYAQYRESIEFSQQPYPGEKPNFTKLNMNRESILKKNSTLIHAKKVFAKLKSIIKEDE